MQVQLCPGYKPHKFQRRAHQSRARFKSLSAGTRGGKTNGAAADFVMQVYRDLAEGKGRQAVGVGNDRRAALHYWVVSPTVQLLKEPKRYLREMVPAELFETPARPINSQGQMWLKPNILVEFRSADNPFSLVSVGLNGMWLDEAARIKAEAWKGNLRGRLTDKRGWALFSSTPLGRNWFYEEVVALGRSEDARYADYEDICWTTADNDCIPGIAEEVEHARLTLPWRYFQREYLASYDAFLGNIYDEFDEKVHVVSEDQLRAEYGWALHRPLRDLFKSTIAGVDWGWTSPGSIVVVGDTGRELIACDEEYAPSRRIFDPRVESETWVGHAKRLRDKWRVKSFQCDPSKPENVSEFTRAGLNALGAYNEVSYGIRKVAERLHPVQDAVSGRQVPRMRILDTCKNLVREKRSYVWDTVRGTETFRDLPAPNQSDHALDAERYAVVEMVRYEPMSDGWRGGGGARPIG